MKNTKQNIIKTFLTLLLTLSVEVSLADINWATDANLLERLVSLDMQRLNKDSTDKTLDNTRDITGDALGFPIKTSFVPNDLSQFFTSEPDSIASNINEILDEAKDFPLAKQISIFLEGAQSIADREDVMEAEVYSAAIVRRCADFVTLWLPFAGASSELLQKTTVKFLTNCFTNAYSYSSSQVLVENSNICPQQKKEMISYRRALETKGKFNFSPAHRSQARFGWEMAQMAWKLSTILGISESSRAIVMIRILGYLTWDLLLDTRISANRDLQEIVKQIKKIQDPRKTMSAYNRLVSEFNKPAANSLEAHALVTNGPRIEPDNGTVAELVYSTSKVIDKLATFLTNSREM